MNCYECPNYDGHGGPNGASYCKAYAVSFADPDKGVDGNNIFRCSKCNRQEKKW